MPRRPWPAGFFVLRKAMAKSRGFAAIRGMLRDGNIIKSLKYVYYYY